MNFQRAATFSMTAAALLALAGAFTLGGCKGNSTSAAMTEKHVGPPPQVAASPAPGEGMTDLSNPAWSKATWYTLVAPTNTAHTTTPVKAAMIYDPSTLYVAFVSEAMTAGTPAHDAVSVYLDSSAERDGTETMQITCDSEGALNATWIRTALPAQPKEDGSPEWTHPTTMVPNVAIKNLKANVSKNAAGSGWTAVVAIPLKGLPNPLRATPAAGEHWKINLLRTVTIGDTGAGVQRLQANLSPVYVGGQAVSPYRMSVLTLGGTGSVAAH